MLTPAPPCDQELALRSYWSLLGILWLWTTYHRDTSTHGDNGILGSRDLLHISELTMMKVPHLLYRCKHLDGFKS